MDLPVGEHGRMMVGIQKLKDSSDLGAPTYPKL